jgi:FtsP/CotA-like multicopper oxidase with cupredoxin domain
MKLASILVVSPFLLPNLSSADETASSSSFPELEWVAAAAGSYYDFTGSLEFCEGSGSGSGSIYGFRTSGTPCGDLAPLIRMQAGKKYQLLLMNTATDDSDSSITNLHTHGLHIGGDGNEDNIIRSVQSGYLLLYNWTIPSDHMDGKLLGWLFRLAKDGGVSVRV